MDTFMDKLAQKFNAQEMIKANAAAEAAETARLKEQNAVYEEMLGKLQTVSQQNEANAEKLKQYVVRLEQGAAKAEQNAEKLEQGAAKAEQNAEKLEQGAAKAEQNAERLEQGAAKAEQNAEKVEQGAAKIEQNAAKIEELTAAAIAKIEEMQVGAQAFEEWIALLEELKKLQEEKFEQLTEHVHKENVKVYRNVQAVVVEELAKVNETAGKKQASFSGRLSAALGISIVALLVGAANLAFQILVYLHII